MNDAFAELVGPIFQHVIDFQDRLEQGDHPALEAEREHILTLLEESTQRARTARELSADFELAKYALVYWIDEVLINSTWTHAEAWRKQILEWDFYRENVGGDRFFEKAREGEELSNTDALETFYLCVALGFRGKYAFTPTELQNWSARGYAKIVAGSKQPERFLPDDARDVEIEPLGPLPGKSILLAVSILVSISALVTLVCFLLAVHLSA